MRDRDNSGTRLGWAVASLIGLFLLPLALTFLVWVIGLFFAWWLGKGSAHSWTQMVWHSFVERDFFPGWELTPASLTGMFWIFFALWGIAWWGVHFAYDSNSGTASRTTKVVGSFATLMIVGGLAMTVVQVWNNDKDLGAYWNRSVEFVIEDPDNVPSALRALSTNEGTQRMNSGNCAYVRSGDVPACITVGEVPTKWVTRKSSADAALAKLKKASTGGSNTYVMDGSLTYLYSNGGMWTAIRDGKARTDLDAVVQWDGTGESTECRFAGDYAVKGSFQGDWSHNLPSTLREQYPGLYYDLNDAWGYCNGNEPVVVLPVTRQIAYGDQSVMTNAGVLVIRGDHGTARIYQVKDPSTGTDLAHGQFPGPTYPISLTKNAREASSWAAGRVNHSGGKFGFEPTDSPSQQGNVSEYMLQNAQTGELDWVTPLTPRGSDSQQFIAWAITPAGSGRDGTLNTTKVYVLPDNDPKVVNLADLEASTKAAVTFWNPGFFSAQGKITEFLPIDENTWQAYVELGNRVVARLDIPTNVQIATKLTVLDPTVSVPGQPSQPSQTPPGSSGVCSQAVGTLSTEQLRTCATQALTEAQRYTEELAKRAAASPTPSVAPSPAPSASTSATK